MIPDQGADQRVCQAAAPAEGQQGLLHAVTLRFQQLSVWKQVPERTVWIGHILRHQSLQLSPKLRVQIQLRFKLRVGKKAVGVVKNRFCQFITVFFRRFGEDYLLIGRSYGGEWGGSCLRAPLRRYTSPWEGGFLRADCPRYRRDGRFLPRAGGQ